MNYFIYILTFPLIWLFSKLPFGVLYFISDILYAVVYYIIGYRKKVVFANLKTVFPSKSEKEIKKIAKKFYKHFVDVFIEMIKSFTISEEEISKRYKYPNIAFLNNLYKDGKSGIMMGAHYANWEWILGLSLFVEYKGYAAFTKIGNPYFNEQVKKSRSRFGTTLVLTQHIIKNIEENKRQQIQAMYGLLSDQSPSLKKTYYWNTFLGVKVPIHTGAEMLAKKYDMDLVFMNTKKIKRGYYETTFSLINQKEAKKYADYELTDIFLKKVETQIYNQPEFYFWTHKRFKHRNKAPK